MATRLTTAEWIAKATIIHGDRYDYSKVEYRGAKAPVTVVCRVHGSWSCDPSNHTHKNYPKGCPVCGGSKRKTTEDFVRDACGIHGDLYGYSEAKYVNAHTALTIICKEHGAFQQTPTSHLSGASCPKCATNAKFQLVRNESLSSIKKRLSDKTDGNVSIIEESFTNINAEATFTCNVHGQFRRVVNLALYRPNSCIQCFHESDKSNRHDQQRAEKKLFSMLLDSDVSIERFDFKGAKKTTVVLNCLKHGKWTASWTVATQSHGRCPKCSYETSIPQRTQSITKHHEQTRSSRWSSYLAKFKEIHGDQYDYSRAKFVDAKTPIKIVCPIHGVFTQVPDSHAVGGCRQCANDELAGLYSERYFELKPSMASVPATLYLLKLEFDSITCFKIGITRTTLKRRFGAALGKGVKIEVIAVRDGTLIEVWRDEVRLLSSLKFISFEVGDRAFARAARLSPSELLTELPSNWRDLAAWTSNDRYWL